MVAFEFRKQLAITDEAVKGVLNEAQDSVLEVVRLLNAQALVTGLLKTGVSLSTTASLVRHDLGYEARGFIVVDKTASIDVYRDTSATNPDAKSFIALRTASGSGTVSLWIF